MPTVRRYRSLAPFSLEELVDSANRLLRTGRGKELTKRTVRYYVSEGLIPPPIGPAKFARYTYQHLLMLIIVRASLDHGLRLELISKQLAELESAPDEVLEQEAEKWLAGDETKPSLEIWPSKSFSLSEAPRVYESRLRYKESDERLVRRIPLTEHSFLEIDAEADLARELRAALRALQKKVL
ncbi:MAG: MerR family transcriptional regulator [Fimbriimonadales bacterium]|nr:MerR family transcriptional regulator [Fimbriimonadales bacterium]